MRVLVLGGDGYLGWPAALHFSAAGHDVTVVDNYIRRRYDRELETDSLVPIATLPERIARWRAVTGAVIGLAIGDLTDAKFVTSVLQRVRPDTVIHLAEQRSAPYSMMDQDHAVHTQVNNVVGTLNVLWAIAQTDPTIHLVKLGTMGEYGTPNIDIEEGWLRVTHNGRTDVLPYPKQAGSFYHLSKVHDSHNILFCCRAWGLRATDLNQGVVYGAETAHTRLHPELATRFDYDAVFGTVLNRFIVQAVIGHPLTVYGTGGQTRGFLDIVDTVRCLEIAADHPSEPGEFRVFNQFTESFSVLELAEFVAALHEGQMRIEHVDNPRVEMDQHYYHAAHDGLLRLGLEPHPLSAARVEAAFEIVHRHRNRIDPRVILPLSRWKPDLAVQEPPEAAVPSGAAVGG